MNRDFKYNLRQNCLKKRKLLSLTEQNRASQAICERISQLPAFYTAQRIAFYAAVAQEIDVRSLESLAREAGKQCYYPFVTDTKSLLFLPATSSTIWKNNRFNIPEPQTSFDLACNPSHLDLVIAPLLGFDDTCNRLGSGGGYYDRTFAATRPALYLGVSYDFQHLPHIEAEIWDIPLDAVVTPTKIYWRTK